MNGPNYSGLLEKIEETNHADSVPSPSSCSSSPVVESNIETHARVWPIAGRLLQEVKRCKESVDGVAKSW